jgi:hypothetical protein
MAEKQFKYTATIKQPQTVGAVKLDPKGGTLSEREYKALKKDAYGASLIEKGLLVVGEGITAPDSSQSGNKSGSDDIPDFDN